MLFTSSRGFRSLALLLFAGVLLAAGGCGISLEQDPAETVTVEISGISDSADRDAVGEKLGDMADGSSHLMRTSSTNDTLTVHLSPVADVEAFSKKIDFGKVTEVKDRTVKVTFEK